MTRINILDKSVFNRIAAGEVVEKPASIVKELVENSIDAGATHIRVEIRGGGIKYIRVSDDGKGIPADNVKTAFLPHATSKISTLDDLDAISTLGFRGEALPSIASVATVTMITRTSDSDIGTRYVLDNGTETDFGEIGAPVGTTVTVEDLFARIPARRKFLQKDSTEENAITACVAKFILANPNVSFEYVANDKTLYFSDGNGVESAIITIYGKEYLANTSYVQSNISDIVLCGYINKPAYTKHSRLYQTLVVNGRYVQSDEISFTVFGCYQKYLMKRQYPTYVLYLNLPCDLVDVNVHPSKTEVRFATVGLIKKLIADTVKEQVLSEVSIPKEIGGSPRDEELFQFFTSKQQPADGTTTSQENKHGDNSDIFSDDFSEVFLPRDNPANNKDDSVQNGFDDVFSPITHGPLADEIAEPTTRKKIDSSFLDLPPIETSAAKDDKPSGFGENASIFKRDETLSNVINSLDTDSRHKTGFGDLLADKISPPQSGLQIPASSKLIGKLFNTYIIIERGNDVYLIDQHAAHEKILFDKLMRQYENDTIAVQKMLVPYEFKVSPTEVDVLCENLPKLRDAGFSVSHKGGEKFTLSAVPATCSSINVQSFVSDFLSDLRDKVVSHDLFASIMQSACKAAVKGEDDLSDSEIETLLSGISENVSELFCPHGRPISVRIGRTDIEKWFKRLI